MKLDKHMIRAGAAKIGGGSTFTTRERLEMSRAIITAALAHLPAGSEAVKPLDERSLSRRIGEAGNQIHNLACENQNRPALMSRLEALRGELWELARPAPPSTPPAANVQEIEALVEKFDEAAKSWGWVEDQGYGPNVQKSKDEYEASKNALLAVLRSKQAPTVAVPDEGVEDMAKLLFAADWPNDKWDRFKAKDAAPERYRMLARVALRARAEQREAPSAVVGEDNGLTRAIAFIQKRHDDYVNEHGSYDGSTGATEFPGNGDEYVYELEEIIEGLEALRGRS